MRHIKILFALCSKGKNRLREHGDVWHVLKTDLYDGKPAILAESTRTGYERWWIIDQIKFEDVL